MQSRLIRYFRDCYREDNQGKSFLDIFSKSVEFAHVFESFQHPENNPYQLPFVAPWADKLLGAAELWRREKSLVLGAHICIANIEEQSNFSKEKIKSVCAPILLYDAILVKNGENFNLVIDKKTRRINYSVFDCFFEGREYQEQLDELLACLEWNSELPDLEPIFLHFNSSFKPVVGNEKFLGDEQSKQIGKSLASDKVVLLSGLVSALIPQSLAARGVLDELEQIAVAGDSSAPLNVFDNIESAKNWKLGRLFQKFADPSNVPRSLSHAQQSILHAAVRYPLSVVIGPPGTGKSYTIASMALERFMAGESILIVAKSEYAVDVIRDKLVYDLGLSGSAIIRAGAKDYLKQLKQFVDALCQGSMLNIEQQGFRKKLRLITNKIKKAEKNLKAEIAKDEIFGLQLAMHTEFDNRIGVIDKWRIHRWLKSRKPDQLLVDCFDFTQNLKKQREDILARRINEIFIKKINNFAIHHRKQIKIFRKVLGARSSALQDNHFSDLNFKLLLNAMPVWVCSLDSLHRALPLQRELFDLVIIDEATQCDVATCIPALYRARRAVVVGDTKQLRHFSFLSRARQRALMVPHGLTEKEMPISYRDHSMLDFADQYLANQQQLTFLDEHFRSIPSIIDFSNREFYESRLKIMTLKPGNNNARGIEIFSTEGKQKNGVNKEEAALLIQRLHVLVEEQMHIPEHYRASIGVVSFFRDQAEYLEKIILKEFPPEDISRYKLRAGTAYQFQGEERDIILISCAIDDKTASSSMAWLNRADAFNVAITRAKSRQYIFISFNPAKLNPTCYLAKYLHNVSKEKLEYLNHEPLASQGVKEFMDACTALGVRCLPNYEIAKITIDFLLEFDGHTLAIDLVGFSGGFHEALNFDRYELFERAGLPLYAVSFFDWNRDKTLVLKKLRERIAEVRESSMHKRRSLGAFTHHWTKLLTTDYDFAKKVQLLEGELLSLGNTKFLQSIGELIDAYLKLIWILNETLNEGELTYSRYCSVAEMTLHQGVATLEKAVRILKASKGNSSVELETVEMIASCHAEIDEGVRGLNELALHWASYTPDSDASMRYVLDELERLGQRVQLYKE